MLTDLISEETAAESRYASRVPFTYEDAERAYDEWNCNCGPAALAAVLGMTLDAVRPLIPGFEQKGYTNPTMMFEALKQAPCLFHCIYRGDEPHEVFWCDRGLMRVQWSGPWTKPGVPMAARYRATHWVGLRSSEDLGHEVFDVNAMCVGGWLPFKEWSEQLVPWLLREVHPKADGRWWPTHIIVVTPRRTR